jgi:hypothetical protein
MTQQGPGDTIGQVGTGDSVKGWSAPLLQKLMLYVGKDEVRHQIKYHLLDPLLQHVLERVYPYIILICVLFVLLLFVILITLGIIVFQIRGPGSFSAGAATVGTVGTVGTVALS